MSRWNETPEQRLARFEAERAEGPTLSRDEYTSRSRRSFLTGAAGAVAGYVGWRTLQGRPEDGNVPDVLRKGYEFNEQVWQTLGSQSKLAPTYDLDQATSLRVNGRRGVPRADDDPDDPDDIANWQIDVIGVDGAPLETIDLSVIHSLPQTDFVVEHKCIEGWSARPHWGGARFADLATRYAADVPPDYSYVALTTPDNRYYVGLDRSTMLNAQTLLATHLAGEPLEQDHGSPVRLATPHKYGIKSLKRIGTIRFTNERPPDYWAERGYTYWAGF